MPLTDKARLASYCDCTSCRFDTNLSIYILTEIVAQVMRGRQFSHLTDVFIAKCVETDWSVLYHIPARESSHILEKKVSVVTVDFFLCVGLFNFCLSFCSW